MASDTRSILNKLERVAGLALEAGFPGIADDASALSEKAAAGRFYVACVGQFKRGKSSLIDALLGERLLPVGILPVTAIPTIVQFGATRRAEVRFEDGSRQSIEIAELAAYVSESENPGNARQVRAVEVYIPKDLLRDGLCLVDTPGISSVFDANTAATRRFVPNIDVALVVLGSDPPISGDEVQLVKSIAAQLSDFIFVLNKSDRAAEREREEASIFAAEMLAAAIERPVRIFEVSATERLEGAPNKRDWPKLLDALASLARTHANRILTQSVARGFARLSSRLLASITERRRSLEEPIENSVRRVTELERHVGESAQAILDLDLLLGAEQSRVITALKRRELDFLESAGPRASDLLHATVAGKNGIVWGPACRRKMMNAALDSARAIVPPWLAQQREFAQSEYNRIRGRFAAIAENFAKALYGPDVTAFAELDDSIAAGDADRSSARFQFTDILRLAWPASPFRYVADVFAGAFLRRRYFVREAERFLAYVLEVNANRVDAFVEDLLQADRKRLGALLGTQLTEARKSARQMLSAASETLSLGASAVSAELERLNLLEQEARAIVSP